MNPLSPLMPSAHILPEKPRMLVVDDEPINLDLLYRTFRRKFTVLKADSGAAALEILAREGEVAVIISDQRMPQMKGTEFLSKTVPDFPDTIRMILTGFTDSPDLVDAINAGQVYRYITKPWDPDELARLVDQALAEYSLSKHQRGSLHHAEKQSKLITLVGQVVSQSMDKNEALTLLAEGFGQILNADACILLLADGDDAGYYGKISLEAARTNELIQSALSTQSTQSALNLQSDTAKSSGALYAGETQAHLAHPISYRRDVLGVLSLQWNTSYSTLDDVSQLLNPISPLLASSMKTALI